MTTGGGIKSEMFQMLLEVVNANYADMLPPGFKIHLVDEYDEVKYPAPNLWMEKREKPDAKYIAILTGENSSVPALGETVTDAINTAIAKIHKEDVKQ